MKTIYGPTPQLTNNTEGEYVLEDAPHFDLHECRTFKGNYDVPSSVPWTLKWLNHLLPLSQGQLVEECKLTLPEGYSKLVPPAKVDESGKVTRATINVNVNLIQVIISRQFFFIVQLKLRRQDQI